MSSDEGSVSAEANADSSSLADTLQPKLDLAFKDGETIKINITVSMLMTCDTAS